MINWLHKQKRKQDSKKLGLNYGMAMKSSGQLSAQEQLNMGMILNIYMWRERVFSSIDFELIQYNFSTGLVGLTLEKQLEARTSAKSSGETAPTPPSHPLLSTLLFV